MQIPSYLRTILLVLSIGGLLAACSNSGGGIANAPAGTAVSGAVSKGPVTGATVDIYTMTTTGAQGTFVIGNIPTDQYGAWNATLPAGQVGPFLVIATGGSYVDEYTGATIRMGNASFQGVMEANATTAPISPITDAAISTLRQMIVDGYANNVAAALPKVKASYTASVGFDPLTVLPPAPQNLATATADQKKYAALLGGVSKLVNDAYTQLTVGAAVPNPVSIVKLMAADLGADGIINGQGSGGISLSVSVGGTPKALNTVFAGGANLGAATTTYQASPNAPAALAGTQVTVTPPNFNQTLFDKILPVVSAPAAITVATAAGATAVAATNATIATFLTAATATDNVGIVGAITNNAPTSFPVGVTTVTFSATDAAGNIGTATATVTVSATPAVADTIAPTVTAPASITVPTAAGATSVANTNAAIATFLAAATATDNVGVVGAITNNAPATFPVGVTTVTFSAKDAANNSGTATANVTVTATPAAGGGNTGGGVPPVTPSTGLSFKPVLPTLPAAVQPTGALNPGAVINGVYVAVGNAMKGRLFTQPNVASGTASVTYNNGSYTLAELNTQKTAYIRTIALRFGPDGLPVTADDVPTSYTVSDPYNLAQTNGALPSITFNRPGTDGTWFTADDLVSADSGTYALEGLDGAGNVLIVPKLSAGPDRQLFTADDVPGSGLGYDIATLDVNGNRVQITHYGAAGPDALWFTSDDVPANYILGRFDIGGLSVQTTMFNGAGADATWFTTDDVVMMYALSDIDLANLRINYQASFTGAAAKGLDGLWFTPDDVVTGYTYFGYDAAGHGALVASHTNKGVDGAWFTADDTASAIYAEFNPATGKSALTLSLTGYGPDTTWHTGDDALASYARATFNAKGNQTLSANYSARGADALWFTADDVPVTNYWQRTYDPYSGKMTFNITYTGTGLDGFAFTSDDYASSYTLNLLDSYGTQIGTANVYTVAGMGADGIPFTADDVANNAYRYIYNALNQQVQVVVMTSPGADGNWFTTDDLPSSYTNYSYDAQGRMNFYNDFTGAGVDGAWFNADDYSTSYRTTFYDVNGNSVMDSYSSGLDGLALTADDLLTSYETQTLNAGGKVTGQIAYNGAGADGAWHTADDVIWYQGKYAYTASNLVTSSLLSYSSGADGIWWSADDTVYYNTVSYDAADNMTNQITYVGTGGAGPDGLWATADDQITSQYFYVIPGSYGQSLATNAGSLPTAAMACNQASVNAGTLNVYVRDDYGMPLQGATVQLDQSGGGLPVVTTGANGLATFAALNGTHDVHVFMNNRTWESFYCVQPNGVMDIYANAPANATTSTPPAGSYLKFNLPAGNITGANIYGRTDFYLVDAYGNVIVDQITGNNAFPNRFLPTTPVGTTFTGDLWAVQYVNNLEVIDAVLVQANTTLTTVAAATPAAVTLSVAYNAVPPALTTVSQLANINPPLSIPAGSETMGVSTAGGYVGLFALQTTNWRDRMLIQPTVMPQFAATPAAIEGYLLGGNQATYDGRTNSVWHYRQPIVGAVPAKLNINSNFAYEAMIFNQVGTGWANPVISWSLPILAPGGTATMTTLALGSWNAGVTPLKNWVFHVPVGDNQVVLPTVPANITVQNLAANGTYDVVVLRTDTAQGMSYNALIGSTDLSKGLPRNVTTESLDGIRSSWGGNAAVGGTFTR